MCSASKKRLEVGISVARSDLIAWDTVLVLCNVPNVRNFNDHVTFRVLRVKALFQSIQFAPEIVLSHQTAQIFVPLLTIPSQNQ